MKKVYFCKKKTLTYNVKKMKKKGFLKLSLFIGLCLFTVISCKKEKIPVLSTTAISDISATSAKSGGNISDDKGATVTKRGVCWSTDKNPTIQNDKTEDGSGAGSFVSLIFGLEPHTTYYVRAYATNSAGTAYGSTMSFTTKDGGSGGSFTDPRDGNVYKTVSIGNQVWMAENLRYLPGVVGPGEGSLTTVYYYVYDYVGSNVNQAKAASNYTTYGVLYNWPAACTSCPSGWHLPTDAEWTVLTSYLGGNEVAGGKLKETGTVHWNTPNIGASNETEFTALPGGYRNYSGMFEMMGGYGSWWSTDEYQTDYAWLRSIGYDFGTVYRNNDDKSVGVSVRCVKD
jgi:uncharacterized protein (TIGR02145 family)